MLNEYKIQNFKAFTSPEAIPIRPITLIYGPNSSGKSSLIQSLLLLKQTLEESDNPEVVLLPQAGLVDLGEHYSDFVYRHEQERQVSYKILLDLDQEALTSLNNLVSDGFEEQASLLGIGLNFEFSESLKKIVLASFQIFIGNKTLPIADFKLETTSNSTTSFKLVHIYTEHLFWHDWWKKYRDLLGRVTKQLTESTVKRNKEYAELNKALQESKAKKEIKEIKRLERLIEVETELAKENIRKLRRLNQFFKDYSLERALSDLGDLCNFFSYRLDKLLFVAIESPEVSTIEPKYLMELYELYEDHETPNPLNKVVTTCFELLRKFFYRCTYIGSLRQLPQRQYVLDKNLVEHITPTGERVFDILCNKPDLRNEINEQFDEEHLDLAYQLKLSIFIDGQLYEPCSEEDLKSVLSEYTNRDNPRSQDITVQLRLIDQFADSEVSLSDVGFGISQILPVIVQSLFACKNTILIEQPEIHIHPRLQAELGSLLLKCIQPPYENTFIIETHSEALMLRIQKLIRKKELDFNKVSVIYVDRDAEGSRCLNLRLNTEGRFRDDWPGGFFEEGYNERFG